MATFEETISQLKTQTSQPTQRAGSFEEALKNIGGVGIKAEPRRPFFEREGIVQSILKPAANLGKDIAQLTPQFQEMKRQTEEAQKQIADRLKQTDLSDRTKQIIANIADEVEPLKDIFTPRTPEQMIGDLAGTVLLVVTPASLLRGVGTGLAAQALRGAITGGAIGGAAGFSEGEDIKGVLKSTAIGVGLGAVGEPVLGLAGQGIVRGGKFIAEKAKPVIEKIS